jgi:hypothetical protein
VINDVPVDDEVPLVTSEIYTSAGAQSFGGAHRGRVCVRVFIGVSVRACCERLRCTVSLKKQVDCHPCTEKWVNPPSNVVFNMET